MKNASCSPKLFIYISRYYIKPRTTLRTPTDLASSDPTSHINLIDLKGNIVIPSLIDTHSRLAQSLLRGLVEDLPLRSWLCDAVWPLEASYAGDDGYVAAMLTIAEMLKSKTTCFLEAMLTHRSGWENIVRAVGEMRIRACLVSSFRLLLYFIS